MPRLEPPVLESLEHQLLLEKLRHAQGEARCLRRAVWLMAFLGALAAVGLCYVTLFLPNFPPTLSELLMQSPVRAFGALGIASLISLLVFSGVKLACHKDMARMREARRQSLLGAAPLGAAVPQRIPIEPRVS